MDVFIVRFFLFLSVNLWSVVSYTVVLKPVKPLYPSVKVYRYELRHPKIVADPGAAQYFYHKPLPGQRLYPVAVKQPRDPSFRTRVPAKKEKRKFVPKAPSAAEKPLSRDHRLYGLPQQLVPPLSNQIEEYSESKEEEARGQENDIRALLLSPPDEKSFPSFGQEKGRIYTKPGDWATPAPTADPENNGTQSAFTPSQLYLQIRHKNTVIHVPQTEALKDAETLEELINAPRLKELARTTHVQEVYSEEGYEDAGYDHAGHIRNAQHGEVYDAKDEGRFRIKEAPVILDYDSDLEESKKVPLKNLNNTAAEKAEARITRGRGETPKSYKGEHKFSSRVKAPFTVKDGDPKGFNFTGSLSTPRPTFPSYFGEVPPPPANILLDESFVPLKPPGKKSSKYRKGELNSTKIYPVPEVHTQNFADFKPYISLIDSQASPSAKSLKYSRIYSKKTKQLRLEPYQTGKVYEAPSEDEPRFSVPSDAPVEEQSADQRIVLPTIGYINSLTTAHFGKGVSGSPPEEPKPQLTSALNLTQALDYLRTNKNPTSPQPTEPPVYSDIRTFEPMKLKKSRTSLHQLKTKRDVYLMRERDKRSEENYEGNDESDEPHDEKNEEIAEDERKRIEEENREKEKYEAELREEISKKEKEILAETFKNLGVREDISEVFPDLPPSDTEPVDPEPLETSETPIDPVKYPFYFSKRLPENSALRYATDPTKFPRKSGTKMEFYESREDYIQCPDFHPDLEDLPDSNSTEYSESQAGENQRLLGVGDKILCLRMKYFDREPFDNPIFKEKEIDYVGKPKKRGKLPKKKVADSRTKAESKLNPRITKNRESRRGNKTKAAHQALDGGAFGRQTVKATKPVRVFAFPKPPADLDTTQSRVESVSNPPAAINFEKTFRITARPPKHRAPPSFPRRVSLPYNCLHMITKIAVLEGDKNVTVDCNDATLVQHSADGIVHLRIIPRDQKPDRSKFYDDTDWIPIPGYALPRNRTKSWASRKTDLVTVTKNETRSNPSSDHYVIDELKEDENVRRGEVVEDMDHYLTLVEEMGKETTAETSTIEAELPETSNATRRKREEPGEEKNPTEDKEDGEDAANRTLSRPFEYKRTLTRLSGRDFLVRYHKNKGKPKGLEKTADFWKITTPDPVTEGNVAKTLKKPPEIKPATLVSTTGKPEETQQPSESRKISPLNLIPEKVTKKSETRHASEFWKTTTTTTVPPEETQNFTKIITKVSRESSESSEKPLIIHKKPEKSVGKPGNPSEGLKYKTINRNPGRSEPEEVSSRYIASTDGPILYYVVNGKTGRGKWITNYEERRRSSGKLRKARKFNNRSKTDKRGKKQK